MELLHTTMTALQLLLAGDAVLWSYAIDRAAPTAVAFTLPHAPASPSSPASIITVPDVGVADRKKTRD